MSNIDNNNILGPSISQGEVFRKQQKSRISNNNDVVTGNAARNKNKIKNDKKNGASATTIEPFSLTASNNYKPVSNEDIREDNAAIKITNDIQKAQTRDSVVSYSNVSNNLSKFQQGVTDEAKAYNNINKNSGLLNQNYLTADNKTIRVNNAGVINTLVPSSLQQNAPITPGINISTSTQNPEPAINYIPVENIPPGLTKGSDTGLYGAQTSSTSVSLPPGVSGYNLEGENVFVVYPYPNTRNDINKNMFYYGAYTIDSLPQLVVDPVMPKDTTLNCLQRAVDQNFSWCGMRSYGNAQSGGGGGQCMVGTANNFSYPAYNVITISQSDWTSVLKFPSGYSSLTFGADGVLYAGYSTYNFAYPLTKVFNSDLDPTYGGTINSFTGSYGLNQGFWNWQNLANFSGNSDPTGQSSASFNTLYQYDVQVPNTGYYTYYYYNWIGQLLSYQAPYIYYTTEKRTQLLAPNTGSGNITYINYNCGKVPTKNPIYIGGQNGGAGYNISCNELYGNYPSFTLELSEDGVLTIINNTSSSEVSADSKIVRYDMSFKYKTATLSNGRVVQLNMPRSDWVNESINKGQPITSSSRNTTSIINGQTISSRNGYCRLYLTNGTLQLQYSLQNVSEDADGNLVGTDSSSVAVYYIQNVNSSNLGATAHIDINGAVNPYPPSYSLQDYDNVYTKIQDYIPSYLDPNNTHSNYSQQDCEYTCSNSDSLCYGYVYGKSMCNIITTSTQIIGNNTINKIPISGYDTYVRNPKFPRNDKSCRKEIDNVIGTEVYSYYLGNGVTSNPPTPMRPDTKCNLGKVLNNQMTELKKRNIAAVQKGEQIKGQFLDLFDRENNVLNSISGNRTTSKIYDEYTKKAVNKIQEIQNAQITKSAAEKDSELLLISDNYRYVIWGIVSLLLSITAIKALRVVSR
jgi:hypothetical protein